ncbi:MAG: carbon-nitrogen hydrolase family protein [Planctomycetes bacterium]|nr:carbon-nitrogen hydrolase family protein [Planctomycetota bacterium]
MDTQNVVLVADTLSRCVTKTARTTAFVVAIAVAMASGSHLTAADLAVATASLSLERAEAWAPLPDAAPIVARSDDGRVTLRGNGTRLCCGGWQYVFSGVRGGKGYRFEVEVRHSGLDSPRDSLAVIVLWDRWKPTSYRSGKRLWNYAFPTFPSENTTRFSCVVPAPPNATHVTVRYVFRWSTSGSSHWTAPRITPASIPRRSATKICVVAETRQTADRIPIRPLSAGKKLPADVARSVDLWGSLILKACEERPQLVVTPELVIAGQDFVKGAIRVPGPATEPFQKIARDHATHLVLGVRERDGDAIRNSAVLIGPDGQVQGVYRKVHLACSEQLSGLLPGDSFPVFDTQIGRIGCLICMDTTLSESARMLALGGADIICFPIMGDLRADRWSAGPPIFDEGRWRAIMRTRAIDNQVCMVVARNGVKGSCIINRKGDILAWNEGDREVITATLPAEDGYRVWNGGDFREITFMLRRPQLYRIYSDPNNFGPLSPRGKPPQGYPVR